MLYLQWAAQLLLLNFIAHDVYKIIWMLLDAFKHLLAWKIWICMCIQLSGYVQSSNWISILVAIMIWSCICNLVKIPWVRPSSFPESGCITSTQSNGYQIASSTEAICIPIKNSIQIVNDTRYLFKLPGAVPRVNSNLSINLTKWLYAAYLEVSNMRGSHIFKGRCIKMQNNIF